MSSHLRTAGALTLTAALAVVAASGHAADPKGSRPAPVDPGANMEMQEISPKEWLRRVQQKLSEKYGVDPAELRFSPAPPKLAAFVRGPPAPPAGKRRKPARRRWDIVVVDVLGQKKGQFRVLTAPGSDEPPKDLRFLNDERLVYEVVASPPPAPKVAKKKAKSKKARPKAPARKAQVAARPPEPPGPPRRFFVIQPVSRRARAIRCQGVRFAFNGQQDRLAFVGGSAQSGFVSVNGLQVYPRRGRTLIASDLAWSRDGHGLAFLETPPRKAARLVLLGATDNPREDTTWELPPSAPVDGARVFWIRPGRLVVGKTTSKPVFTASFFREDPDAGSSFTP